MRRARRLKAEMNVVPYIDVMLVLLVIFMVAAPLIQPGQIDLPAVGKTLNPTVAPIEIRIAKDGAYSLFDRNNPAAREVKFKERELIAQIIALQAKQPDQAVVIAGDKEARYEWVLKAMDALQQAGVTKVGLLAKAAGKA